MNKITVYLSFVLCLLFMEACTSEEAFNENTPLGNAGEVTEIEAISLPFDLGGSNSRTSITMGATSIDFPLWAEGDTIGIYPSAGGDQLSFPIVDGIGKNTCVFTGGGWALKTSTSTTTYTYTAYTPFNRNYYFQKDNTALPVSMLGQKQKGNDSSKHLGAYDLQIANGDTPTSGKISFTFNHKVAIVRMDITAPCAANWKSITLNSDAAFTTKAAINLSLATPTVTPTVQFNSVTLDLENVSTTDDNLQIVAYMMMLPVDFTGKVLNMDLVDADGNMYTTPVSIDNPTSVANPLIFDAGNARWISAEFAKGATPAIPYVTFIADAEQTLTMSKAVSTLEYSVNGGTWAELGTNTVTFGGDKGNLQLRGTSSTGTASSTESYSKVKFGSANVPVACLGDIRTLVDYQNYSTANTSNARFCYLFDECYNLTTSPKLPATTLATECYYGMFNICKNLTVAPELPATTLATSCYNSMFSCCYNLAIAPELPATTLAKYCYGSMFYSCVGLATVPEYLPAIELAEQCYNNMFYGCTALTAAPQLPAIQLSEKCYYYMFDGCSNLVDAPQLPATTLAYNCYEGMFNGCTSLTTAPMLPALTLVASCYKGMFSGCSSLNSVTMLATSTANYCFDDWLYKVSSTGTFTKAASIESLPGGASGIPTGWTVEDYVE